MIGRTAIMALCSTLAVLVHGRSPEAIAISQLKTTPLKYDGKPVEISGWLISGHSGVFVYDEAKQNSIRVRAAEEVSTVSKSVLRRDKMYAEFWRASDREISKDDHPGVHVQFKAIVRILKAGGKPAKEFSVLGQFPIELIPIQVMRIELKP